MWALILLVEKKTGNLRMLVNYSQEVRYPLPHDDDLVGRLFDSQSFSCLDGASGFRQSMQKYEYKPENLRTLSGPC